MSKNDDGSYEVGWEEDGVPLGKKLEETEIVPVPFQTQTRFPGFKFVSIFVFLVAFSCVSLSFYLDTNKVNIIMNCYISTFLHSIYSNIYNNSSDIKIHDECEKLNKNRFFPIYCIQKINFLEVFDFNFYKELFYLNLIIYIKAYVHVFFSALGRGFNSFYLSLMSGLGFFEFFMIIFFILLFLFFLLFFIILMINKM